MKLDKAPCGVAQTVSIAQGNNVPTDAADSVKGGILKGTKYSWICQGPFLKIVDVSNGEKIAGWRFGASCLEFITDVSCAIEFPYTDDVNNLKQIILGLECEVIGGMICIFDVQGSRLLRAIRIPGKPLSLSIVDSGSSGCEGRYPLPGLLSSMSGIIAVGLQGGSVFLIDLCRLSCDELLNTWFSDDREEVHDEMNPCQLLPINKNDDDSDALEKKCAAAAVSGDHLCLHLNESSFVHDNFLLLDPDGIISANFKAQHVGVTSLLYVPRIASLIVGYSFGCFQLWNLMHLTLNYTSRMMKDPLPVAHLGFQEPSDDPCNFCYLWAVHSSTDAFPSSSPPVGIMYGLSYDSKEWVDGYGCLYQDYQSCHFRFEYNLEVDASEDVDRIDCVSFNTLSNFTTQRNMPEDGYDEATTDNDFSLCVFAWETYDSENKPISTYLSVFDLNQWYKDQMPVRVTETEDENLGYLVTFSLNCIRQKGEGVPLLETSLLDVRVDPQNLSQFKSFQPQEEHFHPSALSFVSHCLLEDRIVSLSHPGLQRYLLLYMEKEGPICLLRPLNLFKHCVMVGLKPVLVDVNGATEMSAVIQREFLLSIALENQMLGFLHRCASDWANGSVSGVDCSLPMLLNWGFQRAVTLQETANGLCVHLFDHTGIHLDKNECRLLDNCASQLRQLATLFEGILGDCRLFSLPNLEDFKQKTNELTLIALYFEVLLWFLNVGLLPEFPEDEFDHEPSDFSDVLADKIPYPSTVLTKFYTNRRQEFKSLNLKNGTKASLYIDQLLKNEVNGSDLSNLWQSDGGSGMYPPPSIQSLLAMYLQDGIDIQTKNSIVIYVFLDLATILDQERYSRTIEYFVQFPCAFCMTPSIIKVTQAFWLLDQKHFEDALDMLLDPLVSPKDMQSWQHRFIVHALLSQGQHAKALEYFTVRQLPIQGVEDIQLKISLLVMNKQVTQAYNFLQQYHNEENNKELMYYFYQECGKVQQLGTVLKLMLSPAEEELLMNFLQNSSNAQSDDMQVVFYLMRSRVIEAVAVNERINFSGIRKIGGRRPRNDPTVRDVLVGGYAKTLPSVTRQLANYCSQQKKSLCNWRQVQRPTPMSVDVHYGTKQPVSYKSSLIHATLEKARETWMMSDRTLYGSETRNKNGDTMTMQIDVSTMQNLPFLCTSHDALKHDRETTPVVFPSVTTHSVKRHLDDDGSTQFSTPMKRSRLESTPPIETFLLSDKKKSEPERRLNNSLLLKSPFVKRVTPLKHINGNSANEKNGSKPFAETFTPQSILKVRNLVRSSTSPEHQNRGFSNSDLLTRDLNQDKHSEEKSCARQIRFSIPVVKDLEENKPLSTSTPSDASKKFRTPTRIVDASARLPIRSSLSLLQKSVVDTNDGNSRTKISDMKNLLQKSSQNESVIQDKITNSRQSSLTVNLEADKISPDSEIHKLNDSLGEESFYSAASSSDSGASKDYDKGVFDKSEISPISHGEKYIHNIKEIKPRKQLSRIKVGSQSNFISEKREMLKKENERCFDEEKESHSILGNSFNNEKQRNECSFIVDQNNSSNDDHDDDDDDDDDEVIDSLKEMAQKNIVEVEKNQYMCSSDEENSEKEDISVLSCAVHKKSILGDTCFENSEICEQNEAVISGDLSLPNNNDDDDDDDDDDDGDDDDDSSENNIQISSNKISQSTEEYSILKIEGIKARRPLSRLRMSGKFDTSYGSTISGRLYTNMESSISKKEDILLDNTNIEISLMGGDEMEEDDNIIGNSTVNEESTIAGSAVEISEFDPEARNDSCSLHALQENKEFIATSGPIDERNQGVWKKGFDADISSSYAPEIAKREEQEVYCEESTSLIHRSAYHNSAEMNYNKKQFSQNNENVELIVDGEKTYTSLLTVTTQQTNYEHFLPAINANAGQGKLLTPKRSLEEDNLFSTTQTSINDVNASDKNYFNVGKVGPVRDVRDSVDNLHDDAKNPLSKYNEDVESIEISDKQSTSSAAGSTSDATEAVLDESEENSNVKRNVQMQEEIEQIIVDDRTENDMEVSSRNVYSCGIQNSSLSTINMIDIHEENNHSNDEIIIVDSDPESNRIESSDHIEYIDICSKSYENNKAKKDSNKPENIVSEQNLCWNEDIVEAPLVLKLSDSESESESNSVEEFEIQSETMKEDDECHVSAQSYVNSENNLCNTLPGFETLSHAKIPKDKRDENELFHAEHTFSSVMESRETTNDKVYRHSSTTNVSNPTSTNIDILQNENNLIYENQVKEQGACGSVEGNFSLSTVHSDPAQLTDVSESIKEIVQENSSSPCKERSSLHFEPLQIHDTLVLENKGNMQEEEITTRRTRLKSRPSSVQSEPPQILDVSETQYGVSNRQKRRRNSLQIDSSQGGELSVSENKIDLKTVMESSIPRTRQRSHPSSVQSESPKMSDVCVYESKKKDQHAIGSQEFSGLSSKDRKQRSSLQIESIHRHAALTPKSKDDIDLLNEQCTPRTRRKCRSSSTQSEPPLMSDVCSSDSKLKDQHVEVLQEFSDLSSRGGSLNSLQKDSVKVSASLSEHEGTARTLGEHSTPKTRRRYSSSVQSEPPQMADVSTPKCEQKCQAPKQEHSESSNRARRRRYSLPTDTKQAYDTLVQENKDNCIVSIEHSAPTTRQKSRSSSVHSLLPEPSDALPERQLEKQNHRKQRSSQSESEVHSNTSSTLEVSVAIEDCGPPILSPALGHHLPASSEPEVLQMNLRSRRSHSVQKESFCVKEQTENIETSSDLETCSVQSEPAQLSDVAQIRQLRSHKLRKTSLKKKNRRSTYVLKIPSSKLSCVKEEPEIESSVGDIETPVSFSQRDNERSAMFMSGRKLRSRSLSESGNSLTSSLVEVRRLRSSHSDKGSRADSPASISSKSTVILDKTKKRKRCSAPSSPEEQEMKKFLKGDQLKIVSETAAGEQSSEKLHKDENADDTIEQYATARRLTRYQKTLMERSMEVSKSVRHELHERHIQSERSTEDSDGESEASGYTSGSSHVRSSARLREKRHVMDSRSPSESPRTSGSGVQTPQKPRYHSPIAISSADHNENSPSSIHSGRSAEYASSVSSSQWPSPTSIHPQSVLKSRRKSFQNAQKALFSPSRKKQSSVKSDTSEAESYSENDGKGDAGKTSKNELDNASETGSIRSRSSAVSSTQSINTRSSPRNVDSVKSRLRQSRTENRTEVFSQEDAEQKVTNSDSSTSTENSPKKNTKEERPTSKSKQFPARESQFAKDEPEVRKSYSAFRTRKYLIIQKKRKSTK